MHTKGLSRRDWMRGVMAGGAGLALGSGAAWGVRAGARPKVAIVLTHFFHRSHAHVILENFLEPYYFNGEVTDPGVDVAALYVDQFHDDDMARGVARDYGLTIYPTIGEALRAGTDKLAVDGVVSIGEHGKYPTNAKGQVEYPRKRFFDEIVAEFRRSGRSVPVFNDKHLSYRRDWAWEMVRTARELGFPFMAGSSVPLAQRRAPEGRPIEFPAGAAVAGAVSIHGGPVESYDFHGLEVLQSVIEARKGGEQGVESVTFLEGDALWKAAEAGDWSIGLADAAMAAELGPGKPSLRELVKTAGFESPAHGILLKYKDGLKAAMLKVGGSGIRWNFACELAGEPEPLAWSYHVGPWDNRNLFRALSHAIQAEILNKKAPYPVERTLLTSCVLDAAMDSRLAGGKEIGGDDLAVAYEPLDYRAMREMGATWKIITEDTPQPKGIDTRARGK